jgi:hypothetical protein
MKAISERKFERMMRNQNCTWTITGSNEHAVWYQGKLVSTYAVWHSKGSKREVGMVYVKRFIKMMSEIKTARAAEETENAK